MKFLRRRSPGTANVATVYSNGISFPTSDNSMISQQNDQVQSPLGEFKSGYDGDGEDATSVSDLFENTCIEKKDPQPTKTKGKSKRFKDFLPKRRSSKEKSHKISGSNNNSIHGGHKALQDFNQDFKGYEATNSNQSKKEFIEANANEPTNANKSNKQDLEGCEASNANKPNKQDFEAYEATNVDQLNDKNAWNIPSSALEKFDCDPDIQSYNNTSTLQHAPKSLSPMRSPSCSQQTSSPFSIKTPTRPAAPKDWTKPNFNNDESFCSFEEETTSPYQSFFSSQTKANPPNKFDFNSTRINDPQWMLPCQLSPSNSKSSNSIDEIVINEVDTDKSWEPTMEFPSPDALIGKAQAQFGEWPNDSGDDAFVERTIMNTNCDNSVPTLLPEKEDSEEDADITDDEAFLEKSGRCEDEYSLNQSNFIVPESIDEGINEEEDNSILNNDSDVLRDLDTTLEISKESQISKDDEQASIWSKEEMITFDLSNKESITEKKNQFQNFDDKLTLGLFDQVTGWADFEKEDVQGYEKGSLENSITENNRDDIDGIGHIENMNNIEQHEKGHKNEKQNVRVMVNNLDSGHSNREEVNSNEGNALHSIDSNEESSREDDDNISQHIEEAEIIPNHGNKLKKDEQNVHHIVISSDSVHNANSEVTTSVKDKIDLHNNAKFKKIIGAKSTGDSSVKNMEKRRRWKDSVNNKIFVVEKVDEEKKTSGDSINNSPTWVNENNKKRTNHLKEIREEQQEKSNLTSDLKSKDRKGNGNVDERFTLDQTCKIGSSLSKTKAILFNNITQSKIPPDEKKYSQSLVSTRSNDRKSEDSRNHYSRNESTINKLDQKPELFSPVPKAPSLSIDGSINSMHENIGNRVVLIEKNKNEEIKIKSSSSGNGATSFFWRSHPNFLPKNNPGRMNDDNQTRNKSPIVVGSDTAPNERKPLSLEREITQVCYQTDQQNEQEYIKNRTHSPAQNMYKNVANSLKNSSFEANSEVKRNLSFSREKKFNGKISSRNAISTDFPNRHNATASQTSKDEKDGKPILKVISPRKSVLEKIALFESK